MVLALTPITDFLSFSFDRSSFFWRVCCSCNNARMSQVIAQEPPSSEPPPEIYVDQQRAKAAEREAAAPITFDEGGGWAEAAASAQRNVDGAELVPAHTVWPTRNVFCCCGRCMTGPVEDIGPNCTAWVLVLLPIALFFYVWAGPLQEHPVLLGMMVLSFTTLIVSFLATSFTDPGIIPRNSDPLAHLAGPPPPYRTYKDEDGELVTDTWCKTCLIYRPPRASHCADCDNCVLDFDHHCPFTRNCIGARNYPWFVTFLSSVTVSCALLLFACVHLSERYWHEMWRSHGPKSGINGALVTYAAGVGALMVCFTGYHLHLIVTGYTTKERLKGRKNGARAMDAGRRLECCNQAPSKLQFRQLVPRPVEGSETRHPAYELLGQGDP